MDPGPGQGGALNRFWIEAAPKGRAGNPRFPQEIPPGPAPEPPRGAAPGLPAARTHCPLTSPRKDACLLHEREPRGSSRPGIRGAAWPDPAKSLPGVLAPEKKMRAASRVRTQMAQQAALRAADRRPNPGFAAGPGPGRRPKMRPRRGGTEASGRTDRAAPPALASPKGQLCAGGPGAATGGSEGHGGAESSWRADSSSHRRSESPAGTATPQSGLCPVRAVPRRPLAATWTRCQGHLSCGRARLAPPAPSSDPLSALHQHPSQTRCSQ